MSTEIYYFSGTGNSLFIAKELIKHLPDARLTPIVKAMNTNDFITNTDTIGFIFPVHALTIPIIVKRFIKKLNIDATQYIFAVATRGGTVFHGFKKIEQLLKKKKRKLDARFLIDMVLNDARNSIFKVPDDESFDRMKKDYLKKVERITQCVLEKEKVYETEKINTIKSANSKLGSVLVESIILFGMDLAEKTQGVNYFYYNKNCNNCGICERVCLSGKIRLKNGNPEWQKNVFCNMCYACINYCPQHAIQIRDIPGLKSHTVENARYHHPLAKVSDIEDQKT